MRIAFRHALSMPSRLQILMQLRGWAYVRRLRKILGDVVVRAEKAVSIAVQFDYARLIIVESSGFVEASVQELLQEICHRQSSGTARNYAISHLNGVTTRHRKQSNLYSAAFLKTLPTSGLTCCSLIQNARQR